MNDIGESLLLVFKANQERIIELEKRIAGALEIISDPKYFQFDCSSCSDEYLKWFERLRVQLTGEPQK